MRWNSNGNLLLVGVFASTIVAFGGTAGAPSTAPAATQPALPPAPEGFFAYATGPDEIQLYWAYVDDPQLRHNIYRSTMQNFPSSPQTLLAREIKSPNFDDREVRPDTTYYYRVTAINADQESAPSREDGDTTLKKPPGPGSSPSSRPAASSQQLP